jgi:very-short-patch-repair endonuclease
VKAVLDTKAASPQPLPREGGGAFARASLKSAGTLAPLPPRGGGAGGEGDKSIPQHEFVKQLRSQMTDAENLLWRHLRANRLNGAKFKRQQAIGLYVVDFIHFGARLIIEADGGQHNGAASDTRRDAWLKSQGFRMLRFWNNEILQNIEGVLEVIMDALKQSPSRSIAPSPQPLPREGGGAFAHASLESTGGDEDLKPMEKQRNPQ